MYRLLPFIFFAANVLMAASQPLTLLECHVVADVRQVNAVTGNMSFIFHINEDSTSEWSFSAPRDVIIHSVVGRRQNEYNVKADTLLDGSVYYTLLFAAPKHRPDSIFITIEFSHAADTLSFTGQTADPEDFLLPYERTSSWLPYAGNVTADRATMELHVDSSFTVVSAQRYAWVINSDSQKVFFWNYKEPISLGNAFSLCGMKDVRSVRCDNSDSTHSVQLYFTQGKFDTTLADTLTRKLVAAAEYFSDLTGRPAASFNAIFAFIGNDTVDESCINAGWFYAEHNSPRYSLYDSTIFFRSLHFPLLRHLAYQFCPPTDDSTAFFHYGLAGYLATRYILNTRPDAATEERERRDLIVHAFSFFPSVPLAQGIFETGSEAHTTISTKGRYIFLMLEFIMGRESLDSVIAQLIREYRTTPVSIKGFQKLCEKAYGTSLEWFFQEWFYRSSVPEYVMQWNNRVTARGSNLVTVDIEQRGDVYTMPIDLVFSFGQRKIVKRILVSRSNQEIPYVFPTAPSSVEIDPHHYVLRWLIDTRILAHARSAELFLAYAHDLTSAEREAQLALQLDPINNTGTAPIAYFSLGMIAGARRDTGTAKEYFLRATQSTESDDSRLFTLLSRVRLGNVTEMEGNRNEALTMYRRAMEDAQVDPTTFAPVIIEAKKYLQSPFIADDAVWYNLY